MGWCTPCRDGTPWALELLTRIEQGKGTDKDIEQLWQLCDFMWLGKTHCALAPGAVEPLKSALRYFADDFTQHIEQKTVPIAVGGYHMSNNSASNENKNEAKITIFIDGHPVSVDPKDNLLAGVLSAKM